MNLQNSRSSAELAQAGMLANSSLMRHGKQPQGGTEESNPNEIRGKVNPNEISWRTVSKQRADEGTSAARRRKNVI